MNEGPNMKVLKIHTLEKGWCDKDYVMIHAVFQILVDFIEQEKPDQIVWSEKGVTSSYVI